MTVATSPARNLVVRIAVRMSAMLVLLFTGPSVMALSGGPLEQSWRTASRESAGIAPEPATTPEAIVQVYAARAFAWRGAFAVHTWIATKPEGAPQFTTYEVIGWSVRRGGSAVQIRQGAPDRHWYGARPELLADIRGERAAAAIGDIAGAATAYPYADRYAAWPGPNSNTFVAFVLRRVPVLRADLPPTAIGKDYLPGHGFAATTPSGTGGQVSLYGLAGIAVGIEEGLEINLLGLNFGVDPGELALRLPGIGKVGLNLDAYRLPGVSSSRP
jgi:hypothetical protein